MIYDLGEAHIDFVYGRKLKPHIRLRVNCVNKAMHTSITLRYFLTNKFKKIPLT